MFGFIFGHTIARPTWDCDACVDESWNPGGLIEAISRYSDTTRQMFEILYIGGFIASQIQ